MADLQVWFKKNQMIMNMKKIIYYVYSKAIRIFGETFKYYCGGNIISASLTMTNLGVVLDRNLPMAYQVSKIVRICTYKLRMLNNIRDKFMSEL